MRTIPRLTFVLFLIVCAACTPAPPQPTDSPKPQATTTAGPTSTRAVSQQPETTAETQIIPTLETPPPTEQLGIEPSPTVEPTSTAPPVPQLAFLKDGDIWLLDDPAGQAYQLTFAGDIQSFAWSPDGERLGAFTGRSLCFFQRDGSVRTACLELGLTDEQAVVNRRIVWSPDQRWIVLWNPENPQDEGSIGWLIVALDTTNAMFRIQDPVDWGAELAPNKEAGGFTGQPLFLADSRLLGTLSHRYLCGSGGCRYQLFEFDLSGLTPSFSAYPNKPEDGWSEGRSLILSSDGQVLTNFGAFLFGCDTYHTYLDRFNLDTGARENFTLEMQAVDSLVFTPDGTAAILARTSGCSPAETEAWSQTCDLSDGPEVLPMQRWQPDSGETQDLPPGLSPFWSTDGQWLAFRSCLTEGGSEADPNTPASVYLMDASGSITRISAGDQPAWRPR